MAQTFSDPNLVAAILASTPSRLEEVLPPGPDGRVAFVIEAEDSHQVIDAFHAGTLEVNLARYIAERRRVTTLMLQARDGAMMRMRPELPHERREREARRAERDARRAQVRGE